MKDVEVQARGSCRLNAILLKKQVWDRLVRLVTLSNSFSKKSPDTVKQSVGCYYIEPSRKLIKSRYAGLRECHTSEQNAYPTSHKSVKGDHT